MPSGRRGMTLVELLVAMLLLGVVSTAVHRLLVSNQRLYRQQTQRAELNQNLRAAVALLAAELRELAATDTIAGDIVAMSSSSLVYRAMRSLYVLCQAPAPATATSGTVVLAADRRGLRPIHTDDDGVLLFAEADPASGTDDYWIHARPTGPVAAGTACPGARPSLTVALTDVTPPGGLAQVAAGAPLRSYQLTKLRAYRDSRGDWWLGAESYSYSTGWAVVQPVLGPLEPNGLEFAYFDSGDAATTAPGDVARIRVTVIGRTRQPLWTASGPAYERDTLMAEIALRNNRGDR